MFEDGQVSITLPKVTKAPWEALTASGSKTELRDRRDVSLQAKEARERALAEAKREKRLEDGRLALRKQVCSFFPAL